MKYLFQRKCMDCAIYDWTDLNDDESIIKQNDYAVLILIQVITIDPTFQCTVRYQARSKWGIEGFVLMF